MANVFGVQPPNATHGIDSVGNLQPKAAPDSAKQASDTVEISTAGKLAAKIHDSSMVRTELVEQVRSEIAAGTYETPERIEATVDRLMDELFPNG
jgi:anti-sigma28 factor (negative regulator of flagellin synthesis)